MPRNKDLKRLVRARMRKTGESYTTSRAKIVARSTAEPRLRKAAAPAAAVPPKPDYSALAGIADATIKAKTGCGWELWVRALDYRRADRMTHGELAVYVREKY